MSCPAARLLDGQPAPPPGQTDPGNWTEHAGPVYLEAAGQCVDWGGVIGDEWVVRNGTNCG